jgi:hypothetical protein
VIRVLVYALDLQARRRSRPELFDGAAALAAIQVCIDEYAQTG